MILAFHKSKLKNQSWFCNQSILNRLSIAAYFRDDTMINAADNDNSNEGPMVFIIIAKGYEAANSEGSDLHIILSAPDDDSAVREALTALSEEGFLEADLDQIGVLMGVPEDEPHASAYQGALKGEVAIIRFG